MKVLAYGMLIWWDGIHEYFKYLALPLGCILDHETLTLIKNSVKEYKEFVLKQKQDLIQDTTQDIIQDTQDPIQDTQDPIQHKQDPIKEKHFDPLNLKEAIRFIKDEDLKLKKESKAILTIIGASFLITAISLAGVPIIPAVPIVTLR